LLGRLRLDANVFRRDLRNYSDDDVLLDTGVSFPIAKRLPRFENRPPRPDHLIQFNPKLLKELVQNCERPRGKCENRLLGIWQPFGNQAREDCFGKFLSQVYATRGESNCGRAKTG
jgi:hypothetical protein